MNATAPQVFEANCPACKQPLTLTLADFNENNEVQIDVGTECECGAKPVWRVSWRPIYTLGEIAYDERRKEDAVARHERRTGHYVFDGEDDEGNPDGSVFCTECDWMRYPEEFLPKRWQPKAAQP